MLNMRQYIGLCFKRPAAALKRLWRERNPLENTTDYTFRDNAERAFTPNAPVNEDLGDTSFEKHLAFIFDVELKWQPGQKYIRRPYRKFITKRELPSVTLLFKAGIPNLLGSDIEYQRLAGKINYDFKLGLVGTGYLAFEAGGFRFLANPRIKVDHRAVETQRRLDVVLIERRLHPPEADAHAIFLPGPVGDRSTIVGIIELGTTEFAHLEARHAGPFSIIGRLFDDRISRTAVGAICKWIAIPTVIRIIDFSQAIDTDRNVRCDRRALVVVGRGTFQDRES